MCSGNSRKRALVWPNEEAAGSHRLRPRSLGNDAHSISRRFRYIMSDILCLVILRWSDWYAQELIS